MRLAPAPIIGAMDEDPPVGSAPRERQMRNQWRETSTKLLERYEMSLRDAHGIVVRRRTDRGSYSACVTCAGRQQWAERQFDAVQDAQAWCEHALVARTSN
jgi:hypothetical protein